LPLLLLALLIILAVEAVDFTGPAFLAQRGNLFAFHGGSIFPLLFRNAENGANVALPLLKLDRGKRNRAKFAADAEEAARGNNQVGGVAGLEIHGEIVDCADTLAVAAVNFASFQVGHFLSLMLA